VPRVREPGPQTRHVRIRRRRRRKRFQRFRRFRWRWLQRLYGRQLQRLSLTVREPVWAEIDLDALGHNVRQAAKMAGPARVMAVVKANAYGHGSVQVARAALANGAASLGVARAGEGELLRAAGITAPILIFGLIAPGEAEKVLDLGLTPAVFDLEQAAALAGLARKHPAGVHLKVDTGMGRLGFSPDRPEDILKAAGLPGLRLEGLFTHFATADDPDLSYAEWQLERFLATDRLLREAGFAGYTAHAANSAALINLPAARLDMVRPGIMLYGYHPAGSPAGNLRPVLSFKALVAQVKAVPAGFRVGYGSTHVTPASTLLATLPVGYADGFSRKLSSLGQVLIHGRRAPVLGRVCMDMIMVDVGHIAGVRPGDEAVLYGEQGDEAVWADEVAEKTGTISYEVLCAVGARVPRIYRDTLAPEES